jgi:hypothetical protein
MLMQVFCLKYEAFYFKTLKFALLFMIKCNCKWYVYGGCMKNLKVLLIFLSISYLFAGSEALPVGWDVSIETGSLSISGSDKSIKCDTKKQCIASEDADVNCPQAEKCFAKTDGHIDCASAKECTVDHRATGTCSQAKVCTAESGGWINCKTAKKCYASGEGSRVYCPQATTCSAYKGGYAACAQGANCDTDDGMSDEGTCAVILLKDDNKK